MAGIGFTVALFVTDLAYGSAPEIGVDPAKLAILAASLVAGLLGAAVLFGARASSPGLARRPTGGRDLAAGGKAYRTIQKPDRLQLGKVPT